MSLLEGKVAMGGRGVLGAMGYSGGAGRGMMLGVCIWGGFGGREAGVLLLGGGDGARRVEEGCRIEFWFWDM